MDYLIKRIAGFGCLWSVLVFLNMQTIPTSSGRAYSKIQTARVSQLTHCEPILAANPAVSDMLVPATTLSVASVSEYLSIVGTLLILWFAGLLILRNRLVAYHYLAYFRQLFGHQIATNAP